MNVSERRRKILDIFFRKGSLSYEEILNEMSGFGNEREILNDMDNLVFFRFLEHLKEDNNNLKLRSVTEKQMKNDIKRISQRLSKIAYEIPPWYRKLAILTVLEELHSADAEEVLHMLKSANPLLHWSLQVVNTSLRILESYTYVSRMKKELQRFRLTDKGRDLLVKPPLEKVFELKPLEDEFPDEYKTFCILHIVRKHWKIGRSISTGKIITVLQEEYGRRGSNRRAVRKMLDSMVYCGLLNVSEDKRGSMGGSYTLGATALSIFENTLKDTGETIETLFSGNAKIVYHDVRDFKETVKQFFEKYKHTRNVQLIIENAINDLDLCKEDLSQMSPDRWVSHIEALLSIKYQGKEGAWETQILQCIVACILSRLLPSEFAAKILNDFPVPSSSSRGEYVYFSGVVREYNFNLTKAYLNLGDHEKAFQRFDSVSLLTWESFEFLILKGTIEMRKGNIREALDIFQKSFEISSGKERIVALFHMGLAHFQRGDFGEAEKQWSQCLNSGCTINEQIILRHNLGNTHRISGRLNEARKFYESSIVLAEALEKEKFKFWSCIGLVNTLIDLNLWNEAEKNLREIIQECTEKGFSLILAFAKTSQGIILGRGERYEEAFECHKKALELVDRKLNPQEYSMILINMGKALRQLGRIDEALTTLEEAHEMIGNNNMALLWAIEISLADLYIDVGRFDESWELSHSVLCERWLDNRRVEAEAWKIQGKTFLRKNKFEEAKEQLIKSERIFREYNLGYELIGVIQLLEECCTALGDEMQVAYYGNLRKNLTQKINLPNNSFS